MARQYLIHLPDGTEYGPVDRATLVSWHAEGRLPDGTLVWPDGAPEWLGVAAALGAETPAAPRPVSGVPGSPGPASSQRSRPVRPAAVERTEASRATAFPFRRVLVIGAALVTALVLGAGLWAVLRPWLSRRYEIAAIQRQATPERRVEDREAGLVVDLPSGWLVLRPGNPYVPAAEARLRFALPSLPAFAAVSVVARPRLMDALDAHLDELLQERLPRQPSTKQAGRSDVQLGRGRGRLVKTRWEDGLVAMQGATVTWADGYDLFALDAWAPASAGQEFVAAVESLCRGLTPTGVLAKRVDDAVESRSLEVPELSRETLRLLVAERMSQGRVLDDVPQAALVLVSRGLDALAPAEANEMRAIYQQIWAPVPESQRVRLAALLSAFKAGREVPAADLAQVREALKTGVLALPPADRERLQDLSGRAVRQALLAP